jgi:hypothetical protein
MAHPGMTKGEFLAGFFPIQFSNSPLSHTPAFSRREAPELLRQLPLKTEGAGNAGCSAHPQPRAQL